MLTFVFTEDLQPPKFGCVQELGLEKMGLELEVLIPRAQLYFGYFASTLRYLTLRTVVRHKLTPHRITAFVLSCKQHHPRWEASITRVRVWVLIP